MRALSSRTLASQRERQRQSELRKRGTELKRGRRGQRGSGGGQSKGGDTHTGSVCAEAERIMGVRLVRLNVFSGLEGVELCACWSRQSGRSTNGMCDRRKWRMSGTEKGAKCQRHREEGGGTYLWIKKEERGKGGGKKCKLQERVGSGEKMPGGHYRSGPVQPGLQPSRFSSQPGRHPRWKWWSKKPCWGTSQSFTRGFENGKILEHLHFFKVLKNLRTSMPHSLWQCLSLRGQRLTYLGLGCEKCSSYLYTSHLPSNLV